MHGWVSALVFLLLSETELRDQAARVVAALDCPPGIDLERRHAMYTVQLPYSTRQRHACVWGAGRVYVISITCSREGWLVDGAALGVSSLSGWAKIENMTIKYRRNVNVFGTVTAKCM